MRSRVSFVLFLVCLLNLLFIYESSGQTPGLIIKPAIPPGNSVMDPDGDGYVSQKTNGVQLGFTIPPDNDVIQSELPYVAIIRPDPIDDLLRGPVGGFDEIVGVDAAGNNAILTYNDGTNILFRFRLGGYAPNSKSYPILIDTDQRFGLTGVNADPNALSGNLGFEVEIVLKTNFTVDVYNVDGLASAGTLVKSYPYDSHCQKSIAVSDAGGDPDYFYDFYITTSDFPSLFNSSVPLRLVALTTMNPQAAIGNNALSDVGGVTSGNNTDVIFTQLIEAQTPTTPGGEVLDRSDCPTINAVSTTDTSISGTSTEASGTTIKVYVYASNGTTLIGTGTTTTSGTSWSLNVSAISPSVTLTSGQIVKATATATGEGESYNNCSIKTVTSCSTQTSIPTSTEIVKISGSKGFDVQLTLTRPVGTKVYLYNSNYTLRNVTDLITGTVNPVTTTTSPQTVSFECKTGNCFGEDVYYFRFEEPGKCISPFYVACDYVTGGTSNTPTISTSTITPSTTSISGTGTAASSQILIYADGNQIASTTSAATSPYGWTATVSGLTQCQVITARQIVSSQCLSNATAGIVVSRQAYKPSITSSACGVTPPTTISGNSNEIGATVTLYRTSPASSTLGTATVQSDGTWSVTGLSLNNGDVLDAAVTSGSCLSSSVKSDAVTISTQTNVSNYTIAINNPIETDTQVTGTIASGTYPVTLKVYIDETLIGSGVSVSGAGSWTVTGLSGELYLGGKIQVTLTGTGCESALSATYATVQCAPPSTPSYTGGDFSYCIGNAGSMTLITSEIGVIYQLVNSSGVAVGPASVGNGSGITLYTNTLTGDLLNLYVKAYKIGNSSCSMTSSNVVNFTPSLPTPTVTFSSTSLSVEKGTTSVSLPFSAKSSSPSADKYTIDYSVAANTQGFIDITTETAIPSAPGNITLVVPAGAATGTYSATIAIHSDTPGVGCSRSYGITISVYASTGTPVISVQPTNATICSGTSTTLNVAATGSGTLSYQWQSASSYSGTYSAVGTNSTSLNTGTLTATTYYRVVVTNSNGSTFSNIAIVTVDPVPVATGSITGSSPVCAGQSGTYSITAISNANTYSWAYSGTNATITGTTNSVTVTFASNATSGNLTAAGVNDCGTGNQLTKAITVSAAPFINNMTALGCSSTAFSVTPVNVTNGIVPSGTTYAWNAPVVTGSMTGGASGSGSSIGGTLVNATSSTQTATYTVTPTTGSCTGSAFTLIVSINPAINLTATPVDVICNAGSTGSVNLTVSGGTPGYSYAWTGPSSYTATTQNLSGRVAGTYNVTVTDSKSCTATTSAVIAEPTAMTITPTITHVTCNGGSDGAISISVSGGTGTKTYLWNDGSALQNRTGLTAATYTVTVTDANGCTKTSSGITVTQPAAISASAVASAIACNGGTSTITITASGGTGTLTYSLNGGTYQSGNTFTGVSASASPYVVTVKDASNCTTSTNVTVSQPAVISLSTVLTNETCSADNNGAINLTVSGGTTAYTYDWSNDGYEVPDNDPEDLTGLDSGTYTVIVTDANGCTGTTTVTISAANPNPAIPGTIVK